MGKLIEVDIEGTKIWMETGDAVADKGPQRVSAEEAGQKALKVGKSLQNTIKEYCASLVKTFESIEKGAKPSKITAEFGMTLSGDCKFYVVNSSGKASLKITAEWKME